MKLRRVTYSIVIGAIVLVAAVYLLHDLRKEDNSSSIRDHSGSTNVPSNSNSAKELGNSLAKNPLPEFKVNSQAGVGVSASANFYVRLQRDTDYASLYQELLALQEKSADAKYYLGVLVKTCTMFAGPIYARLAAQHSVQGNSGKSAELARQMAQRCQGVDAQNFPRSPGELFSEAANAGDPKAKAYMFNAKNIGLGEQGLEDTREVRNLAQMRDPVVLQNLEGYFHRRDKILIWSLPNVDGTVSGYEMAMGLSLAACELGYDCSEQGIDYLVACAYRGWCDSGGRASQIRNNMLSPSQLQKAEAVRDALLSGLNTKSWPPGFWSGSNGSSAQVVRNK